MNWILPAITYSSSFSYMCFELRLLTCKACYLIIGESGFFPTGAFQLSNFLNLLWTSTSVICSSLWLITSLHAHVLSSIYFAKGLYDASHSHCSLEKSVILSSFVTIYFSSFCLTVWKISSGHLHFTGNGGCVHSLVCINKVSFNSTSTSAALGYEMKIFFFPCDCFSIDQLFNFPLFTSTK